MISIIQPLIKKPLFGKQRLPLTAFLSVGGFLFETGAVLGWAYRDRQLAFVRVIALPETPDQRVRLMRLKAKQRVAEWKSLNDSFYLFVYETELARRGHPINMMASENEDWERSKENMRRVTDWLKEQSLDLHTAWTELHYIFYEGIGYGFEFPEETQRRWKSVYEKPKTPDDLISWRLAYQYGVVTTPEPAPIQTWDERVSEVKDALREYITEFKPALEAMIEANREEQLLKADVIMFPEIGPDIKWTDIIRHVFHVLEFDRAGTVIGPGDTVKALSSSKPYGYMLVESPILNQPAKLPIVHRDDFLLAASVFDEPHLLEVIKEQELLVTYVPKHKLPLGLAGTSHALHYIITAPGTLARYYEVGNYMHMARPAPEKIFGTLVWDGEIRVQVNSQPEM
jgi:hypothetical protein